MSLKVILAICLIVVTIIVLYIMLKKGEFIQEGLIYSLDIKSDQPSTDLTGKNEKMEFIMPVTQASPNPFEGKGETGVIGHLKTLRTPPSYKMTIVMWINPKNLDEEAYLMQLGRSTANIEGEFIFRIKDGKLNFWDYKGGYGYSAGVSSTSPVLKNKWIMVGFTKNGTKGNYWIDGVEKGITTTPEPKEYAGIDLAIGGDWRDRINTKNGKYFNGEIGQVAIYNRALTPEEMMQNYEKTKSNYSS